MNKLKYPLAILNLLRNNKIITSQEIANELGITQRQVFRYIKELKEFGYDIEGVMGKYNSGYVLHDIVLSNAEYTALYEAKELIGQHKPYLAEDYKKALEKISYKFNNEF